jgi:ornithine cyclodeaminase/alanine dehydrogenase-like protein (mu-crystallin family)
MTSISILGEAQLRELVPLDLAAIDQVEAAFLALATEAVAMPPILRLDLPEQHGEVDVKTAYLPRFDGFAIKVSTGFFNNPALGLPSLNGLMLVLSAKTGLTEAVLLDNGYLTAVRTAAAGAVRTLARRTGHTACRGDRRRRAGAFAIAGADAGAARGAGLGMGAQPGERRTLCHGDDGDARRALRDRAQRASRAG